MLQVIEVESVEVEAKSKVVRVDEEAATQKANEAQDLKNECESDLAEAIPALEAALSALDTLKVSESSQSPPTPPPICFKSENHEDCSYVLVKIFCFAFSPLTLQL